MRLQSLLQGTFDEEFKRYLHERGVNIDSTLFEIKFQPPQNFAAYRQAEVDGQRINTFNTLQAIPYISKRFAMKRFLGITDEELAENERLWREEKGTATITGTDASSDAVALGETFTFAKGTSPVNFAVASNTGTFSVDDATTITKGVASFNTSHFSVASGAVSLAATTDDLTNVTAAASAANQVLLSNGDNDYVPTAIATAVSTVSIDDLSDVTSSSEATHHMLVWNGSAYVNRPIQYVYDGSTSGTSHVVTNNLQQKYCNVTVVDYADGVIIPESIKFDSATQLTVTFNSSIQCRVIVMGVGTA
jgi:hypothetical protein